VTETFVENTFLKRVKFGKNLISRQVVKAQAN